MSKISKAVDQALSSVTSTPRTPRMDLASRLAGKTKKEKEKKEKEKEKEKGKVALLFRRNIRKEEMSVKLVVSVFAVCSQLRGRSRQSPVWIRRD